MKTEAKGFTLIELIVVVLIIGAITFIAVPRMTMATIALGRSQTGAQMIAAAIRHCRTLAICNANTNHEGFELGMKDEIEGSYTRFEIATIVDGLPDTVVESGTIPEKVTCTGASKFRFGPFGNRLDTTDNLTVSAGGKTYLISVVTGTGMVKCTQQ